MGNENIGQSSSDYRGEQPVSATSNDYLDQFTADNFKIKLGTIFEVFAGGYVADVSVGIGHTYAIWLSSLLGGVSGTASFAVPSSGTKVLIYDPPSGPALILGAAPNIDVGEGILYEIENGKVNYVNQDQHNLVSKQEAPGMSEIYNDGRPLDSLPGDWGYINEFGNLIGLLRGLVILKAGGTSQIQLSSIDRLVRIVSGNFEHFSDMGEDIQYNDHGKLSKEVNLSITQEESMGGDKLVDISKEGTDYLLELSDESLKQKERIQLHVGHLGDLIHLYLKKGDGVGVADLYIGRDGRLNIKSAKEIQFQKVSKINIPTRKIDYHQSKEKEFENKSEFAYNENKSRYIQDEDKEKWDRDEYDKKKYHPDDWERQNFGAATLPKNETGEVAYTDKSSRFIQRDDGSICLTDAAGSVIELDGKGSIRISCKDNIILNSGQNNVLLSGNSTTLRAKENLDICCSEGDIRIKANDAFQLYTKNKGMLFETDSVAPPTAERKLGSEQEYSGIYFRSNESAPIHLQSNDGNIVFWSEKNIISRSKEEIRFQSANFIDECDYTLLKSSEVSIDAEEVTVKSNNCYILQSEGFQVGSRNFTITGSSAGTIYGGPRGTEVNHTHPGGEWTYAGDCIFGGFHGTRITKNVRNPGNYVWSQSDVTDIDELMKPYRKELFDNLIFSFRKDSHPDPIVEFPWQSESKRDSWNLTLDEIDGTAPYPGPGYNKFYSYKENEEPKSKPGEFTLKSISKYSI